MIYLGDCREVLTGMEPESFDSCVTDPPAGIAFMGKAWDHGRGGRKQWCAWMQERAEAVYRVLKPGAHALVWALPRTAHWTATAWEDAGFELREKRYHVFGSGFPKSLDVSKAIDRMDAGEEQERRRLKFTAWVRAQGVSSRQIDEATGTNMGGHYTTAKSQPAIMTREHLEMCRHLFGKVPRWVEQECDIRSVESKNMAARELLGTEARYNEPNGIVNAGRGAEARTLIERRITAPATDAAKKWQGWGTATKPAVEEWILFRKPLSEGTVAANVFKHSTGALNVDGCRVGTDGGTSRSEQAPYPKRDDGREDRSGSWARTGHKIEALNAGRWPPNLSHDGSPEALAAFARFTAPGQQRAVGPEHGPKGSVNCYGDYATHNRFEPRVEQDTSPARFFPALGYGPDDLAFFYSGKANKRDRAGSTHPTVKPIALMRWLCRLITPPGGKVLDPFAGSGTTLAAAILEGFEPTGIEITPEHHADIVRRLAMMRGEDGGLFANPEQEALL